MTLPSRLSARDLARLRADGARPAGPPPARPAAALAQGGPVEIDRTVNRVGVVAIGGIQLPIGSPLAGRRVTLRLEAHTAHVIADGYLWRSIPFPAPGQTGPAPRRPPTRSTATHPARASPGRAARVEPRWHQVIRQRVHVGMSHAGHTVTVEVDEHHLRVLDHNDELLIVVARTNPADPTRHKVYSHRSLT